MTLIRTLTAKLKHRQRGSRPGWAYDICEAGSTRPMLRKTTDAPEHDLVVVIQCRCLVIWFIIVAKIEAHVEEQITIPPVNLHLCCGQTVNEPVEGVIFADAIIDEFGVLAGHVVDDTERLTRSVVFEHSNLLMLSTGL